MKNVFFYDTLIGRMGIAENGTAITNVFLDQVKMPDDSVIQETELLKEAIAQLTDYLTGKRKTFDVPLLPHGTEFQQAVWKALRVIPYGETRTYKQIAELVGRSKAFRAVGMANNKNPILIFVPCHRVIGANGKLLGFAAGIDVKEKLINLEKNH
jgi:methylated-DNA-[protein]-cysteine S-methyltransferase